MELTQIVTFLKNNEEFLKTLKQETSDIISDAKADLVKENKERAEEFFSKIGEKIKVTGGEDRLQALDLAIEALEREKTETQTTSRTLQINNELATLHQLRASERLAEGFNDVVAFSDKEKKDIADLLNKANQDIEARKNLKTAIDITVRIINVAAKIAAKGGSFGVA